MSYKYNDISGIDLQRLIDGCIGQDRVCQKAMYDMYGPSMMALCMRYARNPEEAEEVLQDGFICAFRCIQQFKNAGIFDGWLRRIFINCSLQKYRGKYQNIRVISISDDQYHLPAESSVLDTLSEKELIRLVQTLPAAYRMVFNLYVFEGFKHREIAATLGISEGTSKSNLFDARSYLKKRLARDIKIAR